MQNIPEVMECYLMTGEFDYLLRIVVSDASDYERVHRQHLTPIESFHHMPRVISETDYSTLFICIRLSIALCHQHLAFSGIMFAELVRCQEISANIRHLADHPLRQSCCDQDSS